MRCAPSSPSTSTDGAPSSVTDAPAAQRRNQSVHKAAAILRAAAAELDGATVSELARRAALPRATALRMIEALVAEGFLWRLPGERVVLGPELFALARSADPDAALRAACEQPLAELAALVRETITLTVVRADGMPAIVHQLDGPHIVGATNWVGKPFPVHASSSGKLALAYGSPATRSRLPQRLSRHASRTITSRAMLDVELGRIRERGCSEIVDELEDGLAAISVPILLDGAFLGSVNVSGPTHRFAEDARASAVAATRAAVAALERELSRPAA